MSSLQHEESIVQGTSGIDPIQTRDVLVSVLYERHSCQSPAMVLNYSASFLGPITFADAQDHNHVGGSATFVLRERAVVRVAVRGTRDETHVFEFAVPDFAELSTEHGILPHADIRTDAC